MRIELVKSCFKIDVILLDRHQSPGHRLVQWFGIFLSIQQKPLCLSLTTVLLWIMLPRTIEVTMGRIYDYKATYSHYLELRKERREQQQKQFDEQQKMIAETQEFIERFKGTYSKTLQVQSRVKMLEKLEIIEVDEQDTSALRLKFPPSLSLWDVSGGSGRSPGRFTAKNGFLQCQLYHQAGRKSGIRGSEWRRKIDHGQMYHGRNRARRNAYTRAQRENRLFCPKSGFLGWTRNSLFSRLLMI